ncbi:MAG: NAD-binding protein [Planctomycetes bacterium]|nr:NAD-binding protein [Planctomycetota bacterium]
MGDPERPRPIRDSVRFLGSFVRRPARIGAVMPSSRFLADLLVGDLETLGDGDVVVEYGPGTGPMTRVIADRLPEGAEYLGIEIDDKFVNLLRNRFPRFRFVQGSAADVSEWLERFELGDAKRIISGIPFASLPAEVQTGIADGTKDALAADGEFRTFQYAHAYPLATARRFRSTMDVRFAHFERLGPVYRNVPPAYVLVYRH